MSSNQKYISAPWWKQNYGLNSINISWRNCLLLTIIDGLRGCLHKKLMNNLCANWICMIIIKAISWMYFIIWKIVIYFPSKTYFVILFHYHIFLELNFQFNFYHFCFYFNFLIFFIITTTFMKILLKKCKNVFIEHRCPQFQLK